MGCGENPRKKALSGMPHGEPAHALRRAYLQQRQKSQRPVYYLLQHDRLLRLAPESLKGGMLMEYVLCFLLGAFFGALFQAANKKNRTK